MAKVLDVHIGEVKLARHGEELRAILGSCVGIAVIWRARKLCGLAHCLLPENPVPSFSIGAKFVNQAVPSLIALLKLSKADTRQVETVVVGGGNMTGSADADSSDLVGAHNFRVALRELQSHQLRVVHSDGGGRLGRKISVDSHECTFHVETIPRINNDR